MTISAVVNRAVNVAGVQDGLAQSVHYGVLAKTITRVATANTESTASSSEDKGLVGLAEDIAKECLALNAPTVDIDILAPKALLRAAGVGVSISRHRYLNELHEQQPALDKLYIRRLKIYAILGMNPWERIEKQDVIVDVAIESKDVSKFNATEISNKIIEFVEKSDYQTIEALVTSLADLMSKTLEADKVTLSAEKPRAVGCAQAAGVRIQRQRRFYSTLPRKVDDLQHIAYLGMGSNLGERAALLSAALVELEVRGIKILSTSSMYESAPMYVEDQPRFMNAVCKVATSLEPYQLLDAVQDIEANTLKRIKYIDKGPRTIDLDILLYDDISMTEDRLTIPHALMLEREFVLRPLVELCPSYVHPVTTYSIAEHFHNLTPEGFESDLRTVIPMKNPGRTLMFDTINNKYIQTHIMAILNLTPDSFSDGGKHSSDESYIIYTMRKFKSSGVTIVDIGGQSTNPKSINPGPEVELDRILPTIKLIRSMSEFDDLVLSIDTYYASVARACVLAGADIINDVSAGMLDSNMLATLAELDVPVVLMHMRGTPQTMSKLTDYASGVVSVASDELANRIQEAEKAGIKRWNMILDPGLGFAKNVAQNVELVRELRKFRTMRPEFEGLPWLLGPSRKRFVGTITGIADAHARGWGTAAAVVACISGGADIVRIHDIKEISAVVKMADAIYKV